MIDESEIADRLAAVRERIAHAVRRSGRAVGDVTLVLASKTQPPEAIAAAHRAGARDFGENYVQEAARKRDALATFVELRWHLIGHLQSNKARLAVRTFDLIQCLDSARLANALARVRSAPRVRVLIEVNLAGEATKAGAAPGGIEALVEAARDEVDVLGLMTIPPPSQGADGARRYFARLRECRDRLAAGTGLELSELSMGMTDDFEVAIEEGATMIRIGRAVFGERAK